MEVFHSRFCKMSRVTSSWRMRKAEAIGTLLFWAISFKYSSSGELRSIRKIAAFFSSIKDAITAFLVMLKTPLLVVRVRIFC